jgi:outer membrane protein TolC
MRAQPFGIATLFLGLSGLAGSTGLGGLPPALAADAATRPGEPDEAALAGRPDLALVLRLAEERAPLPRASRLSAVAAERSAAAAGRAADPVLRFAVDEAPIGQRWMPGSSARGRSVLGEEIAPPGALRQERLAMAEAAAMRQEEAAALGLDAIRDARLAWADYELAWRERELHVEHQDLAAGMAELARIRYRAGASSQSESLRLLLLAQATHGERIDAERRLASARLALNLLLGRAPDAPLGEPAAAALAPLPAPAADGDGDEPLHERLPELRAMQRAVSMAEAERGMAEAMASGPMGMLGVELMWDPAQGMVMGGAMAGFSLPWLNPRRRAAVDAASASVRAARGALEAEELMAASMAAEAALRLQAAAETRRLVDEELLPMARASLDSARAAWSAGQGDATSLLDTLRAWLELRIGSARAAAGIARARADLDRSTGLPISTIFQSLGPVGVTP